MHYLLTECFKEQQKGAGENSPGSNSGGENIPAWFHIYDGKTETVFIPEPPPAATFACFRNLGAHLKIRRGLDARMITIDLFQCAIQFNYKYSR